MKIVLALVLLMFWAAASAWASVSAGLHGAYFSPSDADFRGIYSGGVAVSGEFSVRLSDKLGLWLEGGYFGKTGRLTFTLEETKLTLVPLGFGADYRFTSGRVCPYVGAGARLFLFHETNVLGDIKGQAVGAVVRAGLAVRLSDRLGADFRASFSVCRMRPADFEFGVGGFELGAGLTFSF